MDGERSRRTGSNTTSDIELGVTVVPTPEPTRFIALVGVMEVLKDQEPMSGATQELVDAKGVQWAMAIPNTTSSRWPGRWRGRRIYSRYGESRRWFWSTVGHCRISPAPGRQTTAHSGPGE